MGETVVGGAYSSVRQASGFPRALAPGRRQPHPNLAPKLMTTCNPDTGGNFLIFQALYLQLLFIMIIYHYIRD